MDVIKTDLEEMGYFEMTYNKDKVTINLQQIFMRYSEVV